MKTIEPFVSNQLVEFSREFILRPRVHRIRAVLAAAAGSQQPDVPLNIPTSYPFLFCALGWSSNRANEGRYTSFTMKTEEVIFIAELTKLACFGGPDGTFSPTPWGPSLLVNTDRFVVSFNRDGIVDPAETYPGAVLPSIVELAFIGFDCLPRSKAKQAEDAQA